MKIIGKIVWFYMSHLDCLIMSLCSGLLDDLVKKSRYGQSVCHLVQQEGLLDDIVKVFRLPSCHLVRVSPVTPPPQEAFHMTFLCQLVKRKAS